MKLFFTIAVFFFLMQTNAQEFMPLWPKDKKPNNNGKVITDSLYNERIWRVATPGMYVFKANKDENKHTAVVICPGGGFERISYIYNGFNFAKWYNTLGINAFVLIYRLPHQADLQQKEIAGWQDAQRAIRIVRSNAASWGIDKDKIGVMGISAGGYVASAVSIHEEDISAIKDSLDTVSFRPNFSVLLSPVITMGKFAHPGSKKNLIGMNAEKEAVQKNSNELNVTTTAPPTFIVHALNDSTVNVQNSLLFYSALLEKKVNASLHIFPSGAHGIKLRDNPGSTELWLPLLELWLGEKGFTQPINIKK